ncbi:DUF3108 domain-containing protein [Beggiatoa leptomitoformis]|uniref:DUF3108 domain-containing protein n=1 Tax=Beggiatoa leptomitoformis TaxID=288004 RepID=A0A2N9YHY1_9GAMM|nr:DUF3108 domain-containing protein [Beggiatoa leptomitoformis]ALG67688.1 DUF3108 domain-containing protein [Beggiatoa leptomitoformis]AUI70073.1 DUF3108 domain-containing protein [Beggiatoa leptomitoformis]
MFRFFILVLHLGCIAPLWADDAFPPPFTAHYTVYAKGVTVGEGTRRLYRQADGRYVFEAKSNTVGVAALFRDDVIEEKSIFDLINNNARPLEYIYSQQGSKKQKFIHIIFDWEKHTAQNIAPEKPWDIHIEDGVVDMMLYQIILMQELQAGKRDLQYAIVDKGEVKTYIPKYLGDDIIDTGLGELNALKYERLSENGKRKTTIWSAPKLHYLPVRVEHEERGDTFSLVLESVEGL